jgi:hypothetical protein
LNELADLQDIISDQNHHLNHDGLLADLQQDVWSRVAALMTNDSVESFEPLELAAAIEIATTGFEVISPPPEVAIQRIFGPPLSETRPDAPIGNASDADVLGHDAPPSKSTAASVGPSDTSAVPTTELASETESDAQQEAELRSNTNAAPATSREETKTKLAEIEAVGRRTVVDETEEHNKEDVHRDSKTNDMLLLPQPTADAPVSTNTNTDRSDREPPSAVGNEDAPVALTEQAEQAGLEQMLLLPMVPDSGRDQPSTGRTMIAGFNPVAMLQIFVGAEPSDSRLEGTEFEGGAPNVGETDIASFPWVRMDQLAIASFVVVVGYWYFHSEDEVASSVCVRPKLRDRRPRRRTRHFLGKYFGRK